MIFHDFRPKKQQLYPPGAVRDSEGSGNTISEACRLDDDVVVCEVHENILAHLQHLALG